MYQAKWQRAIIVSGNHYVIVFQNRRFTYWNAICSPNRQKAVPRSNFVVIILPPHIENRKLLEAAAGTLALEEWERDHLHTCEVCQGVFYVFVKQAIGTLPPHPTKDEPAA
jgi:hypothetical protein